MTRGVASHCHAAQELVDDVGSIWRVVQAIEKIVQVERGQVAKVVQNIVDVLFIFRLIGKILDKAHGVVADLFHILVLDDGVDVLLFDVAQDLAKIESRLEVDKTPHHCQISAKWRFSNNS